MMSCLSLSPPERFPLPPQTEEAVARLRSSPFSLSCQAFEEFSTAFLPPLLSLFHIFPSPPPKVESTFPILPCREKVGADSFFFILPRAHPPPKWSKLRLQFVPLFPSLSKEVITPFFPCERFFSFLPPPTQESEELSFDFFFSPYLLHVERY